MAGWSHKVSYAVAAEKFAEFRVKARHYDGWGLSGRRNKSGPAVSISRMDWRVISAEHAAERTARLVHEEFTNGLWTLATVAVTAPFVGMIGTVWGIVNSFPGCGGERSTCMGAVAELLSQSILPTAAGLLVAIPAFWCYRYLSARVADFDCEMKDTILRLRGHLVGWKRP